MSLSKRQKEIIDAAVNLIAENGIQSLTIKHLAEKIGVTEPALYRHFANKAEIVRNVIAVFDQGIPPVETAGFSAIREFIAARFEQICQNPPLAKVMYAEEFFINDPLFSEMIMEMMHSHRDFVVKNLQIAIRQGEIRPDIDLLTVFRLIMGPVRLLVKQWGMSNMQFDLRAEGAKLTESIAVLLQNSEHNGV